MKHDNKLFDVLLSVAVGAISLIVYLQRDSVAQVRSDMDRRDQKIETIQGEAKEFREKTIERLTKVEATVNSVDRNTTDLQNKAQATDTKVDLIYESVRRLEVEMSKGRGR